ncbi:MAG TPA: hypothetical protein VKE74_33930 [Gemmataceae bacterium]|nr:hypothetical protein [Gemmataceae bacterium]
MRGAWVLDQVVPRATAYGRDMLASVTVGWMFYFVARVLAAQYPDAGIDPVAAAACGFFLLLTFLAFWLVSEKRLERELKWLRRLREVGLLSPALSERLQEWAVAWYSARRFGGPLPPPLDEAKPQHDPVPSGPHAPTP